MIALWHVACYVGLGLTRHTSNIRRVGDRFLSDLGPFLIRFGIIGIIDVLLMYYRVLSSVL